MWRSEDHTADACLYVEAESWSALLEEAVRAFGEWMVAGDGGQREAPVERSLRIEGADAVDCWVRLWRALHRTWVVEGLLPIGGLVATTEDGALEVRLTACAVGDRDAPRLADVKAITWHGAEVGRVEPGPEENPRWYGRIVLDI